MRTTILTATAAAVLAAANLMAGGFWLQLGNPEANAEARQAHAVLTIQAAGCHDPASAKVTATAVGVVHGERRTIPLNLTPLARPGFYALAQQWPKEGKWVLHLEAHSDSAVTSTLVTAGPEGIDRLHAKSEMRAFAGGDVDAMLR